MNAEKIQKIVDGFTKICVDESIEDTVTSIIIFLIATHLKHGDNDTIPIERHAENLKHDFIRYYKFVEEVKDIIITASKEIDEEEASE